MLKRTYSQAFPAGKEEISEVNIDIDQRIYEYIKEDKLSELKEALNPSGQTGFLFMKPNQTGVTPLHYAAGLEKLEALKILIDRADSKTLQTTTPEEKRTVLHIAAEKGYKEICEKILTSTCWKYHEKISFLALKDNEGHAALNVALFFGKLEAAKILLSYSPSISLPRMNDKNTVLHIAVKYGYVDVCLAIVNKLSNVTKGRNIINTPNAEGITPIKLAESRGDETGNTIKEIIESGQTKLKNKITEEKTAERSLIIPPKPLVPIAPKIAQVQEHKTTTKTVNPQDKVHSELKSPLKLLESSSKFEQSELFGSGQSTLLPLSPETTESDSDIELVEDTTETESESDIELTEANIQLMGDE